MEQVVNKWNGKAYSVVEKAKDKVTLRRNDGSQFTISSSEFHFNYRGIYE